MSADIKIPEKALKDLEKALGKLVQVGKTGNADDEPDHSVKHEDYDCLSQADVDMQSKIFSYFDIDNSGELAQLEVRRMLKAMQLFSTDEELVQVVKRMDEDNSGTIDFDEYCAYIDEQCLAQEGFLQSFRERSKRTKLGYDGTSWRKHANVTWLCTNGVLVIACLGVLQFLEHFAFILVPMTMAYFMTFLLGPIQDLLIQRPLLCNNFVCCDDPCFRPGLNQDATCCGKKYKWEDGAHLNNGEGYLSAFQRWTQKHPDHHPQSGDHVMVKEEGQWDATRQVLRWEDDTADCCYFVPSKKYTQAPQVGGSEIKNAAWALIALGKIPDSLSVMFTFFIAVALLAVVAATVSAEIVGVLADPDFQSSLKEAAAEFNDFLVDEYELSITELHEANLTTNNTVQSMDIASLQEAAGPFVVMLNDTVLTLLLCLYMLATRIPESEDAHYKEVQRLTIGEKIVSKVKHYVVLKTALSALTGGAVGMILGVCQVRLFVLFGLMTFLLNYIPNVGSMIAMMLPIPVIIVDTLAEDDFPGPEWLRKSIAFIGPAIVQAYVGNVLEPAVFGKSLNVTAISVLIALVLWGYIWGLQGAILSVPLLAAMKTLLEEADHPMAKMFLRAIRESTAIDDAVEATKSRKSRAQARKELRRTLTGGDDLEKAAFRSGTATGAGTQNPLSDTSYD